MSIELRIDWVNEDIILAEDYDYEINEAIEEQFNNYSAYIDWCEDMGYNPDEERNEEWREECRQFIKASDEFRYYELHTLYL